MARCEQEEEGRKTDENGQLLEESDTPEIATTIIILQLEADDGCTNERKEVLFSLYLFFLHKNGHD